MRYKGIVLFAVILVILGVGYARIGSKINQPGPTRPLPRPSGGVEIEVPNSPVFPLDITDASGRSIHFTSAPNRIVSLAPGATELLFDLGAGDRVVGDTTACDWPPMAAKVQHIGGAFDMSLESIAARNPDLIVADGTINQKIIVTLQAAGMPVLVIEPKNLETSYDSIRMLGRVTGHAKDAADTINTLRAKFAAIQKTTASASARTRVLVMYDVSPIYTSGPGTLTDDIISICGGQNIAKSNAAVDPESVIQDQPDVIICTPDLEQRISQLPGWKAAVPAVTNTAYFHCSDNATLIRAGSRLAAGAEELARFLHPELYSSDGKPAPQVVSPPAAAGAR